jgi:hypothetical protein
MVVILRLVVVAYILSVILRLFGGHTGGFILFEEICDKFVVVNDLVVFVFLFYIELFKNAVHVFGVELEVGGYFLHPDLVHRVEVDFDDISDFEIDE